MNKRVKKLWLDALRTGEINIKKVHLKFKQGTRALRLEDNELCCLGVLCEIYRADTGNGRWGMMDNYFYVDQDSDHECLPKPVWKWAELEDENPDTSIVHPITGRGKTLAETNDEGYSFKQIAGIIERDF